MFNIAEPPASGLPSPADVTVPQTSVVALLLTAGSFRHELHTGLVRTMLYDQEQGFRNYAGELIHTSGANISKARNELFRRFLTETDAEWAWMIDSDMDIPEQTLPRLLCAATVSGAKVIGALCVMVGADGPIPTTFQLGDFTQGEVTRVMLDYPDNTIVQVAATGNACLLVHRTVIEHFAENERTYPWFYEDEISGNWVSEDILFTLRCNEAGFPVFVDCTTPIGHVKGNTTWWPSDIRKGRGFPPAKTYAIIPTKTPQFARDMIQQFEGFGSVAAQRGELEAIVILDNTDDAGVTARVCEDEGVHAIHMPGAGIHEMWNAGIDWCLDDANQRRNVNLLILNDDLGLGPRFVDRIVEALRSDGNLVAVSGNYDNRTGPLVQEVTDICAGRYDGTGGFAGFAFAAKGEWFQSGYKFPEECKWWFGDNDLVMAAQLSGVGKIGIAIDAHVVHLDGGGKTGGDWSAFKEQTDKDRQAFEKRWAQFTQGVEQGFLTPNEAREAEGLAQVITKDEDWPSYATRTTAIVSSIFGGYDQPVTLPDLEGIDCVMVTDQREPATGWRMVHVQPEGDPRYQGKRAKYQPWLYTDADVIVWLDGRVVPSPEFVPWLTNHLGTADVAMYRHPVRSSVLDEAEGALAEDALRPPKYTGRDLIGQAKYYLDKLDADDKLWQTTFIAYRVNDRTRRLGELWQQEQDRYPDCLLDQIPLPWCVQESGVTVADLPGSFWDQHGRLYRLQPHIDGT